MATDVSTAISDALGTLQGHLIDLLDLGLLTKQAHWNVTGPHFRELHLQLDEIAGTAQAFSDEIAERITALRGYPDGQARDLTERSQLAAWPSGALRDHDVVDGMTSRMSELGLRTRERIDALEAEPASQDILIAQLQELEKQTWMMRAQQR